MKLDYQLQRDVEAATTGANAHFLSQSWRMYAQRCEDFTSFDGKRGTFKDDRSARRWEMVIRCFLLTGRRTTISDWPITVSPKFQVGQVVTTLEPYNGPMRITDVRPTLDESWLYSVDASGEGMDAEYREDELSETVVA